MGRPTQDGCKRAGWDDPARQTSASKAKPLRWRVGLGAKDERGSAQRPLVRRSRSHAADPRV